MADSFKAVDLSSLATIAFYGFIGLIVSVLVNACRQTFFHGKSEPPAVFHWIPYIGNAISYGMDPVAFFVKYRAQVCSIRVPRRICMSSRRSFR